MSEQGSKSENNEPSLQRSFMFSSSRLEHVLTTRIRQGILEDDTANVDLAVGVLMFLLENPAW